METRNNRESQATEENARVNNNYQQMLAVRHVAKILGVHESTVRMWADAGVLESYRIGPRQDRRIPAEAVNRVLEASRQWPPFGPAARRRETSPT